MTAPARRWPRADGDGLAVVADLQTAGRGRRGRTWSRRAGVNLMVSVGVRPRIDGGDAGLLGIAAALAVRDACAAQVPAADLRVRWPNDVVDRRRSQAGRPPGRDGHGGRSPGRGRDRDRDQRELAAGRHAAGSPRQGHLPAGAGRAARSTASTLLSAVLAALDAALASLERGESPVARLRAGLGAGRTARHGRPRHRSAGRAWRPAISEQGLLLLDTDAGRVALAVGEVVAVRDAAQPMRRWAWEPAHEPTASASPRRPRSDPR